MSQRCPRIFNYWNKPGPGFATLVDDFCAVPKAGHDAICGLGTPFKAGGQIQTCSNKNRSQKMEHGQAAKRMNLMKEARTKCFQMDMR